MQVDTSRDEAEKARAYLIRNVIVPLHPTCVPLPDLMGICTQVDNITAGLKAERDAATARAEAAERERDVQKRRGDNHWETLRSIRQIARASGDIGRIILWVNDAGSGYTETAEQTLSSMTDRALKAEAERDAARAALREAHGALKMAREFGISSVGFHAMQASVLAEWVDGGMTVAFPIYDSPFVKAYLEKRAALASDAGKGGEA